MMTDADKFGVSCKYATDFAIAFCYLDDVLRLSGVKCIARDANWRLFE